MTNWRPALPRRNANILFLNIYSQNLSNDYSLSVALGDMDKDGDLDAFVATFGVVRVWANTRTFQVFLPFVKR
jgi:hypothetical protein